MASASSAKPRRRFPRRLASASLEAAADAGVSTTLTGSFIAFSSRVLGFYIRGFRLGSAGAPGGEATAECAHQRHIQNQRAHLQLRVGSLSCDQLIFCGQYIEVGRECTLVSPADDV